MLKLTYLCKITSNPKDARQIRQSIYLRKKRMKKNPHVLRNKYYSNNYYDIIMIIFKNSKHPK